MALLAETDASTFSLRALGEYLGVDPTAVYRHFDGKDDLLREIGDQALAPATRDFTSTVDPRDDVRRMCLGLRRTLLRNQVGLSITSLGPTRLAHELRITEVLLEALLRSGLPKEEAALVYHVFIEFTVGSAALDAPLAAKGSGRAAIYRQWRADYQALSELEYPAISQAHTQLYPSSEVVFVRGLDALVDQLIPVATPKKKADRATMPVRANMPVRVSRRGSTPSAPNP